MESSKFSSAIANLAAPPVKGVPAELRFKGRLTKEDLIDIHLYTFRIRYLAQYSKIIYAIILCWIVIFTVIARSASWTYQTYYLGAGLIFLILILVIYRNEMILLCYKLYLSATVEPQEVDTEVIFGEQEIFVKRGFDPIQRYPASSAKYVKYPFAICFLLRNNEKAMTITLPNRFLSSNDIITIQGRYVRGN